MANDEIDDLMFGGAEWMLRDPALKGVEDPLAEAAKALRRGDHAAASQFLRVAFDQAEDPLERDRIFRAGIEARNRAVVDTRRGTTPKP